MSTPTAPSDAGRQEAQKKINDYYDEIVLATPKTMARMPEAIFLRDFFPYFCGEKNFKNEPELLTTWISLARSPVAEVEIVNDKGEPLFRVPAMSDTGVIDSGNANNGQNFSEIMTMFEMRAAVMPAMGTKFLMQAAPDRLDKLRTKSKVFAQNELRWEAIFQRYGKGPKAAVKEEAPATPGALNDNEITFE